ncbi:MAG TPA: PIG-L family deacetylase [Acidimicrobiia bacterium]|nr:PIG-L family deacetylase [Acidimicrobiia bacterium]
MIVVISPHLDDAVLSLGATIARMTRAGETVRVLTVFAGDPNVDDPASEWEHRCGFSFADQATEARRREDASACASVGATPIWLPYPDLDHLRTRDAETIWSAIAPELEAASAILVPGRPLLHPDHRYVADLMRDRAPRRVRIGRYVEQPYTLWEMRARTSRAAMWVPRWPRGAAVTLSARDLRMKIQALRSYRSQLRGYGVWFLPQLTLFEWSHAAEAVTWDA